MNKSNEINELKAEVRALKSEVAGLKEFIQAMYSMMSEDEDCDDSSLEFCGNSGFGRYNT
ncbi:MAG: hypothetical protein LBJ20_01095 [Candidatus Methanoplasma sp.]|jgi:hypothetical protein|nr:hypothetical protein [Candidatus Methanoplasma sp.]